MADHVLTLVKHLNVFAEKVLLEKGVKVSAKSKRHAVLPLSRRPEVSRLMWHLSHLSSVETLMFTL